MERVEIKKEPMLNTSKSYRCGVCSEEIHYRIDGTEFAEEHDFRLHKETCPVPLGQGICSACGKKRVDTTKKA